MVNELQTAMQEDASSTSHPMNNPVSTPDEIKKAFDNIAYKKCKFIYLKIKAFKTKFFHSSSVNKIQFHSLIKLLIKNVSLFICLFIYSRAHTGHKN